MSYYRLDKDARLSFPVQKQIQRGNNEAELRRREALIFVATHRVVTPQLLTRAFPFLYGYDKKAKRDLERWSKSGLFNKYSSQLRFYPDVYVITQAGYEQCLNFSEVDLGTIPRKYEKPKGTQLLHELRITDAAVSRYELVRKSRNTSIQAEGRFTLLPTWLQSKDRPIFDDVVPDYWYLKKDRNGLMLRCEEHFVGEASTTRIKQKLLEYSKWERRPEVHQFLLTLYRRFGAKNPLPVYEIHCVLENRCFQSSDEDKQRQTMMQTFYVPPQLQARVWMTTRNAIDESMRTDSGMNGAIWYRGKDMIDKRERFSRKTGYDRSRVVAEWMRESPTYPLFATP